MKKILSYDLDNINLKEISSLIKNKKLVVYPTDTVYGIGAIMSSQEALSNIYKVKNRDLTSPLIVLLSDKKKIDEIAIINKENKENVEKLINKFWPGGLTIILRKKESVPNIITANSNTIGVRMPNLKIALDLIESVGGYLPTTSANFSGEPAPKNFEQLSCEFIKKVDIIINGGICPVGVESTIIDMTNKKPKLLRTGAISVEEIEKIIGKIEWEADI